MKIELKPIGYIDSPYKTKEEIPRQSVLDENKIASLKILDKYKDGLSGYSEGDYIVLLSYFHKSEETPMIIRPHGDDDPLVGLFKTRSPNRPNPIAMTIVEIVELSGNYLKFKGVDMLDGTPVLDIKPYIKSLNPK